MPLVQFLERQRENREVRDTYGVALAALAVSILALIAAGAPIPSLAVLFAAVLQMVALAVTMRVSGVSRRSLVIGFVCTLGIVTAGVVGAVAGGRSGSVVSLLGWLILVGIAIVGIVRRLRLYRRVTLPLVLGLLCAYLLIGLAFALVYAIVGTLAPPAFSRGPSGISEAVYFSFTTLTTVGYGDVTPANSLVRAISVAEAIAGQLYLVSVVSLAVSRLGNGRAPQPQPATDEEK